MEYKGFEIVDLAKHNVNGWEVPALQNATVYKTESAAKVAITKYLKQQEIAQNGNQALQEAFDILLPSKETIDNPSIPVPARLSREETREFIIAHAEKPQQSRNKREGYFCGITDYRVVRLKGFKKVVNTNYEPKNRKQRKAAKLAWWKQVDNVCDKLFG